MIAWIASYPRSGNTLLRIALHSFYGVETHAIYKEGDAGFADLMGYDGKAAQVETLRADHRWHFVKTHSLPDDPRIDFAHDRVLYVVRDGRDVLVSFARLKIADGHGEDKDGGASEDFPAVLERLITVNDTYNAQGWANHVTAWENAPGYVVTLRFEDLVNHSFKTVQQAMQYLGIKMKPVAKQMPDFDTLKGRHDVLFRRGKVGAWQDEMPARLQRLFDYHQRIDLPGTQPRPILSIVTGTYNRRAMLARMIQTARQNIPDGIRHEFVVVDGGSTDGTLEWCRQQPDLRLIEHGALLGAIKAFCDGARAARGEYVLMANDDIIFGEGSILKALTHLETHPVCGGVAFMDDRLAPGYPTHELKTQKVTVTIDGVDYRVPYAQVGLFPKWLGDRVNWWGDDLLAPGVGRTYGADNILSARIWELGYTIDEVPGVWINDLMPDDALRKANYKEVEETENAYYKAFPHGIRGHRTPQLPNPMTERLRVLYLPIKEPWHKERHHNKRGLRDAFGRVGLVYELDYQNVAEYDLAGAVEAFQPHLMLIQVHSEHALPLKTLLDARAAKRDMLVMNWNGDVHRDRLISAGMLEYLKHVDMQLTVNASVLPVYAQRGIPAAYWQVAYEPVD